MNAPRTVEELTPESGAGHMWVVRSESRTVYVVDLRAVPMLLRQPGAGSSRAPTDSAWVPLSWMTDVRVGERGYYGTDPGGPLDPYATWLQRRIVSITEVTEDEVGKLLAPLIGELAVEDADDAEAAG